MPTLPDTTNWKVAIPIALFLFTQAILGLWWAGNINSTVNSLKYEITTLSNQVKDENVKQWSDINTNRQDITEVLRRLERTNTYLERSRTDITDLQKELQNTNNLLRDFLIRNTNGDYSNLLYFPVSTEIE